MNSINLKSSIKSIIKSNQKIVFLIACIMLGLSLIFAVSGIENQEQNQENNESDEQLFEYTAKLEEKLSNTVSSISGAGNTKVMITLDSSFETIYASNARRIIRLKNKKNITTTNNISKTLLIVY